MKNVEKNPFGKLTLFRNDQLNKKMKTLFGLN